MPTTNDKERDFERFTGLVRPGRFDPRLLQNLDDAGDGYPGLQKALRNWVKDWLSSGAIDHDIDLNDNDLLNLAKVTGTITFVDDVNDLQAALDAGGYIYLMAGTYQLTATLDIDQGKFVYLFGDGEDTIIDCNGDRTAFNITSATEGTTLKDFKIDARDIIGNTVVLDNQEASNNTVIIDGIRFLNDLFNIGYAIQLGAAAQVVENCRFFSFNRAITSSSSEHIIRDNYITGCNEGVYLSSNVGHTVSNNYFSANTGYAITLATCTYSTVSDNIVYTNPGASGGAILLSACERCVVSDNNIHQGWVAMSISSCNYCTITGNSIIGIDNDYNDQQGMNVNGSSYCIIANNKIQYFINFQMQINGSRNLVTGNIIGPSQRLSNTFNVRGLILNGASTLQNMIIGNRVGGITNPQSAVGYGIEIEATIANKNYLINNLVEGNEVNWRNQSTTAQLIEYADKKEYWVTSAAELQAVLDDVGAGEAIINIVNSFALTATIDVDGGGFYIIRGIGDDIIIDCNGDRRAFNVTSAEWGTRIENLKIDATDITTISTEAILISEASNNKIIVENVTVEGPTSNGIGVYLDSNYCEVKSCHFSNLDAGVYMNGANSYVANSYFDSHNSNSIYAGGSMSTIINNYIDTTSSGYGIEINAGVNVIGNYITGCNSSALRTQSDNSYIAFNQLRSSAEGITINFGNYNVVHGNDIRSNTNEGIKITGTSNQNIIRANKFSGNGSIISGDNAIGATNYMPLEGWWETSGESNVTITQEYDGTFHEIVAHLVNTASNGTAVFWFQYTIPADFVEFLQSDDILIRALQDVDSGDGVDITIDIEFYEAGATTDRCDFGAAQTLTGSIANYTADITAGTYAKGDKVRVKVTIAGATENTDSCKFTIPKLKYLSQ